MAGYHVPPLERLVDKFESLPGVGHKSAQRIAYAVLNMDKADAESFAQAIIDAHEQIHYCSVCCNLTDGDLCPVCRDESRDRSVICVVEDPRDVFALERTNEFHATYHVLARCHFAAWRHRAGSAQNKRAFASRAGRHRAGGHMATTRPLRAKRPPCTFRAC